MVDKVNGGGKADANPNAWRFEADPAAAVAGADFVQESAPERLDVKQPLLARLQDPTHLSLDPAIRGQTLSAVAWLKGSAGRLSAKAHQRMRRSVRATTATPVTAWKRRMLTASGSPDALSAASPEPAIARIAAAVTQCIVRATEP